MLRGCELMKKLGELLRDNGADSHLIVNRLFFLLYSGMEYLASNLGITTVGELGLFAKVWSGLDNVQVKGVEALIDASSCEEASEKSSYEVQTVQLDIERWYLLLENTNSAIFFLSWVTSSFRVTTLAAALS